VTVFQLESTRGQQCKTKQLSFFLCLTLKLNVFCADDDSGTIKKDTIERNGDIICPVCKNILKRCQLESHLKKEMEQLVYT